MSSKAVVLSNGKSFATIKLAQDFFRTILRADIVGVDISGADLILLHVLYRDYCDATSWPIPVDVCGFTRGTEVRISRGVEIRTDCFFVKFIDGSEQPFSFLNACSAIANAASSVR